MNRMRRRQVSNLERICETLRMKIARLHEDEYNYRERLWPKGLDESEAADVSDEALDALSAAEAFIQGAAMELRKI